MKSTLSKIKKPIKKNLFLIGLLMLYSLIFAFLTFVYYKRLAAFGCSDDCFNYVGGYLLNKGKTIYSEFFFNHNMLLAYLSALIQKITKPETVYEFILYHKLFLFCFSFLMGILTIIRFRTAAFLALIFYEATKFYVFGDHFLGEAFIVYPIFYMLGLVWEKINSRSLNKYDIVLSSFFCWFCIFAREPYIPLALILYAIILIGKSDIKIKTASVLIFLSLSILTLIRMPLADYFTNLYVYNKLAIDNEFSRNGLSGLNIINIFFYPFKVFVEGEKNLFREILIAMNLIFLASGAIISFVLRKKAFYLLFILLGISNIRPVTPGLIFYEAFHINVWYGILIFSAFLLILELYRNNKTKKYSYLFLGVFLLMVLRLLISPFYFINEKPDRITEFNTNYGTYYTYGTVVKSLADKNDTLFLENTDDLIYWVADVNFSYQYYWYTSHMPRVPKYKKARDEMFVKNPPDFYYDACKLLRPNNFGEQFNKKINTGYSRLILNGKKSCLMVKKDKLPTISKEDWESVKPLGFSLKSSLDSGQ